MLSGRNNKTPGCFPITIGPLIAIQAKIFQFLRNYSPDGVRLTRDGPKRKNLELGRLAKLAEKMADYANNWAFCGFIPVDSNLIL